MYEMNRQVEWAVRFIAGQLGVVYFWRLGDAFGIFGEDPDRPQDGPRSEEPRRRRTRVAGDRRRRDRSARPV
jgi:hypothetical protein